MHSIINSSFLKYYNTKSYYEDMSKYANLGIWILNSLGVDIEDIESLIGEYPVFEEKTKRSLNDDDLDLIEFAKENGIEYKITNNGIRLG